MLPSCFSRCDGCVSPNKRNMRVSKRVACWKSMKGKKEHHTTGQGASSPSRPGRPGSPFSPLKPRKPCLWNQPFKTRWRSVCAPEQLQDVSTPVPWWTWFRTLNMLRQTETGLTGADPKLLGLNGHMLASCGSMKGRRLRSWVFGESASKSAPWRRIWPKQHLLEGPAAAAAFLFVSWDKTSCSTIETRDKRKQTFSIFPLSLGYTSDWHTNGQGASNPGAPWSPLSPLAPLLPFLPLSPWKQQCIKKTHFSPPHWATPEATDFGLMFLHGYMLVATFISKYI